MTTYAEYAEKELHRAYKKLEGGREKGANGIEVHVSDLLDFCPRELLMCRRGGGDYHQQAYVGTNLGFTFDQGRKIQDIVTERYGSIGILYGTWVCPVCKGVYVGFKPNRCPNPKCKLPASVLQYKDTTYYTDRYGVRVVGNIDFMLVLSDGLKGFVGECKSIKKEAFEELTAPLRKHRDQATLYPWLIGIGMPEGIVLDPLEIDTKASVVAYVSKEIPSKASDGKGSVFKFFDVERNETLITHVEEKLKQMKANVKKGLPARTCESRHNYMAKQCAVPDACFGKG